MGFILIIGEIVMRQGWVQNRLDTPTLNGRHRHLERQWHRLETLTESGININCIALGNSMVLNGFDPQIFAQSFQSQSGEEISCFNFGVDALTPVAAGALAQILVETYQPQLLIFGTDARDFAIPEDSEETTVFMDNAWLQYRLGLFNLEGWLVDHSLLYRYRYRLADLVHLSTKQRIETFENKYGFEPLDTVADVTVPPDSNNDAYHIQYYYRVLGNYSIQQENKDALAQILEEKAHTAVVVVEMPVPDTYFNFFDTPTSDYQAFLDTLKAVTGDYQVLFLETTSQDLIPNDGWFDYSHVNNKGATLFSLWLGEQIGRSVVDGLITGFTP
jgi:hypothetical protein